MHHYTDEQIEFVRKNIKGTSYKKMTEMFNEQFGTDLNLSTMSGFLKRNNFTNGINAHFKKGLIPWNKGMKGLQIGGEQTQFKKGQRPVNYRPVGSERTNVDGYVEVKVRDPRTWKMKHVVDWEKENGPVPKGHCVIFGDGDKQNFDLNNLILVSRKQLVRLNQNNLIKNDAELTKLGIMVVDIYSKIGERKKLF